MPDDFGDNPATGQVGTIISPGGAGTSATRAVDGVAVAEIRVVFGNQ